MQVADGGGGGHAAGPQEQKLLQAYSANIAALDAAATSWTKGSQLLNVVAQRLAAQAAQLETSFGTNNPTGTEAARRYREVKAEVDKRAGEMTTAANALKHSSAGLTAAQGDYDKLPPVTTNPHAPQTDLERLMDPGGTLRRAQYDGEVAAREQAAGVALTKLDTHFEKSAEDLRTVAGDRPTDRSGGGGGGDTGGGSPLVRTSGGGTVTPGPSGSPSGGDDGPRHHVVSPDPKDPRDDGNPGQPTPTGTGTVPTGTLAGGTGHYEQNASGGSTYTPGSSATPVSGSGAAAGSALGAGVISGAGAIAASRGGVTPGIRPVAAAPGSSGAIGRSTTTGASRGALGRPGTMVPGQGGAAARATGTTAGRGAGGRGSMVSGQGQGQGAGKGGGRSGAGGRGGRGAVGAGQGGRAGKKDEKDVTQDHLAFADEESWLDDEGAADAVID